MVSSEDISAILGALGIGGAIAAVYIRATIATAVVDKLDKRYTSTRLCDERHSTADEQRHDIAKQIEALKRHVDNGFDKMDLRMDRLEEQRGK